MKKIAITISACLLSISSLALDLKGSDIEGSWLITKLGTMDVSDMNDIWNFDGKKWQVISGGVELAPDLYKISGDTIDLGHTQVKVLEVTSTSMKTKQLGMTYTLEKIK